MEITGYSGASIVSSDFAGLTGLTKLYITDSPQLTTVPANAFSEVTALTWLILHRNDIESVHEDAFNGLSSLIRLELLKIGSHRSTRTSSMNSPTWKTFG